MSTEVRGSDWEHRAITRNPRLRRTCPRITWSETVTGEFVTAPCPNRATHVCMSNGVALTSMCQYHAARWRRLGD